MLLLRWNEMVILHRHGPNHAARQASSTADDAARSPRRVDRGADLDAAGTVSGEAAIGSALASSNTDRDMRRRSRVSGSAVISHRASTSGANPDCTSLTASTTMIGALLCAIRDRISAMTAGWVMRSRSASASGR